MVKTIAVLHVQSIHQQTVVNIVYYYLCYIDNVSLTKKTEILSLQLISGNNCFVLDLVRVFAESYMEL